MGWRALEMGAPFKEGSCVLGSGFGGSHMRDKLSDVTQSDKTLWCGLGGLQVAFWTIGGRVASSLSRSR